MKTIEQIKRLERLAYLINRYSSAYCKSLKKTDSGSPRMEKWISEYKSVKENRPEIWKLYCEKSGAVLNHNVWDCMA